MTILDIGGEGGHCWSYHCAVLCNDVIIMYLSESLSLLTVYVLIYMYILNPLYNKTYCYYVSSYKLHA